MIKIYFFKKIFLLNHRFTREYLKSKGIVITKNLLAANVLMTESSGSRKYKLAKKIFFFKKFITWTNEPRVDVVFQNFKTNNEVIMNVYSGDVFLHNLHFLGSYHSLFLYNVGIDLQVPPGIPLTSQMLKEKKKFCIAVCIYRDPEKSALLINGTNVDLYARRQDLAYFLYKRGKADIVGADWPASVNILEKSDYGDNSRWDRKMDLLKDYKFNLCFENTIYPYYCTEKIWHAIAAGCLPIYYGKGTAIYETFPENSFIDASEFDSHEDLLHYLETISTEEHIKRYNMCLAVMHESCIKRINNPNMKTDLPDEFINNIHLLLGRSNISIAAK